MMTAHRKTVAIPVKTGSRDHRHGNQTVLDSLGEDREGPLTFNGVPIVDTRMLERSLQERDLLLVPYTVASYSTYLSLSSGLPFLEVITFADTDPHDPSASKNCTFKPYRAEMDTSLDSARLLTRRIPVTSRFYADRRPRRLWVTTIPSYEDVSLEVEFDGDGSWYGLNGVNGTTVSSGFGDVRVRLSLPQTPISKDATRVIYGIYVLYK